MILDGAGSLAANAAADTAPASSRFLFSARICGLACARGRKGGEKEAGRRQEEADEKLRKNELGQRIMRVGA